MKAEPKASSELETSEDSDGRQIVYLVRRWKLGPIGKTSTEDALYDLAKELLPDYQEILSDHEDAASYARDCAASDESAYREAKEGWTS